MLLKTLRQTHPSYDSDRWDELESLVSGGTKFHQKIRKFLPQNAVEPNGIYHQRVLQAHYQSYVGAIINLYVAWLFSADFEVHAHTSEGAQAFTPDPFYGVFQEDIGDETTFSAFTRERFRTCLTTHEAFWLVQLPSNNGVEPTDAREYENRGLGRATLRAVDNRSVLDWECGEDGRYEWVSVHSCELTRPSWAEARDTVVETWRIYDPENVTTFEIKYPKNKKPSDNDEISPKEIASHGFKRVPLIKMHVPHSLCIGEQTRDAQIEHFRLDNALSWLIRRTCYAQPVFHLEEGESKIPTMGAGYAIVLGAEDKFGWTTPSATPFDVLQKNVDAKRDEIYRVTSQMAQSVDNNAETVGRSADSKEIDAAATRIMLQTYASYVAKAIEETYETISEARGDTDYEWSVEGFSGYDTATVASLIGSAQAARALGIPSQTFHKALCKKVANAMFAGEDQRVKETIAAEIDKATFDTEAIAADLDLQKAQAELLRAQTKSEPVKADAAKTSASASVITAKKPAPKPTAK